MQPWQIVVALAVILVAGGTLAWFFARRRRTQELSQQFGPEYRRAVEERGDRDAAERELATRQKRVAEMEIRSLAAEQRDRYARDWRQVQADFVDDPPGAIGAADRLVAEVMGERGYPMGDFEQRAADVSVNHPTVVADYRAAHAIAGRQANGDEVSTEELRQAMVHYRSLFDDLLETQPMEEAAHA
jgi:hypothetical protein